MVTKIQKSSDLSEILFPSRLWCNLFNPPIAATHYGGYSYKVSWKISNFFLNHPFFVSMATAAKFVQPIPIFFGLSRSTRCGCCSYQVSSISGRQVTCYDHFCGLGDILCLLRFLLLLLFFFFLSSAKSLSDTFLGDYWTDINETSQEC
jgi:hypothetical protein